MTGCCGFIGSHLCEALLRQDPNRIIVGVDIAETNLSILLDFPNFVFQKDDVRHTSCIGQWKPSIVIHLASLVGTRDSLKHPISYCDTNINGFVHLMEECVRHNVRRVVYASSSSVYGASSEYPFRDTDPTATGCNVYACTKQAVESLARMYSYLHRIQTIGLRFFTVYGPRGRRDMAPFLFLSAVQNGNPITVFDRDSTRDYTYVLDIVNGIMACIQKEDAVNEVYNLGSGCAVPISQLIGICEELTGKQAIVDYSTTREEADMRHTLADISRVKKELGYEPTVSLEDGMRLFYQSDFS